MEAPAELGHAGAVVDRAIQFLIEKKVDDVSIASALLGGAMGLLSRSMSDDAVVGVLEKAVASVRSGALRQE